jgi:mRNA interferase MazF
MKRSDVYYAELDPVLGSEQKGTRPVLILQNNLGNLASPTTIIAPITCRFKHFQATHVELVHDGLYPQSVALLEQIRTIDKCRLLDYVCTVSREDMRAVEQAIHISLGLNCYEGDFENE